MRSCRLCDYRRLGLFSDGVNLPTVEAVDSDEGAE